jgi:hypothetical protein
LITMSIMVRLNQAARQVTIRDRGRPE